MPEVSSQLSGASARDGQKIIRRAAIGLQLVLGILVAGWAWRHFAGPSQSKRPGADQDVAVQWVSQLRKNEKEAMAQLTRIGPAAVPALSEGLTDTDFIIRINAATTLGQIGPQAQDAVPALARLAQTQGDPWGTGAIAAIEALGKIGPRATEATPVLRKLWADTAAEKRSARAMAGAALVRIGHLAPGQVVPRLVDDLTSKDQTTQDSAIRGLEFIGPDAFDAIPALIDVMMREDKNPDNRLLVYACVNAMDAIDPSSKHPLWKSPSK